MTTSQSNVILQILDAIDYKDDKNTFVFEFVRSIYLESIFALVKSLPKDKQEIVITSIKTNTNNPEKVNEILKTTFSKEAIDKALSEQSKKMIASYLQEINDVLTDSQKKRLAETLRGLGA